MSYTCAALILNYNGRRFLEPLYKSLLRQRGLTAIVLIDNASTDDSVALTQSISPNIEIIQNTENLDYGTAYNRAIGGRQEDVILLLNNDTTVHVDAVHRALLYLEQNPQVASVTFESLHPELKGEYVSEVPPQKQFGKVLCPARRFRSQMDPPLLLPGFLWGAACCIRREVFNLIQFDEDFDWYFEDTDLGWSITRTLGLVNVMLPCCTFYHFEGSTSKARFERIRLHKMMARNAMLTFAKNGTSRDLLKAFPYFVYHILRQPKRMELLKMLVHKRRTRKASVPLKMQSAPPTLIIDDPLDLTP